MAFPDDLLKDAYHLASRGGKSPKQTSLRRAVSTAYYALFHLLIADFVANWALKEQRARLGRMIEHRKMSAATFKFTDGNNLTRVEADLRTVIDGFGELQRKRYTADYDVETIWSRADVLEMLRLADSVFQAWRNVRKEKIAQEHLLNMFGARRA